MKSAIDGKQCLGYGLYEQWCRQAEMLRRWAWSMWRLTLLTLSARAKKLTVMRILFVEKNTPPPMSHMSLWTSWSSLLGMAEV